MIPLPAISPAHWVALGYTLSQVMRFGLTLVLTRLLAPEIYAISAILSLSVAVVALSTDLGLNERLQQHPDGDKPEFVRRIWSLGVLVGVTQVLVLAILGSHLLHVFASVGLVESSVLSSPKLGSVFAIYALVALLSALEAPGLRLANRLMQQKQIVSFELLTQAINSIILVLLAFHFRSIEAVVAATLLGGLVRIVASFYLFPKPTLSFRLDKDALQPLRSFSAWVWLSSVFTIIPNFFDRVFFAANIPARQFGLYVTATWLVLAFDGLLNSIVSRLAVPRFSRDLQNSPAQLASNYYGFQHRLDALVFGFVGFSVFGADAIIKSLFDQRYWEAADVLRIAAMQIFASRFLLVQKLAIARGTVWRLTQVNILRALLTVIAVPLAFYLAGLYVAIACMIVCTLTSCTMYYLMDPWFRQNVLSWRSELRWVWVFFPAALSGALFNLLVK